MLLAERKLVPWFWLGWAPRGPAGSLRFAGAHSELHSGGVSIHPLKDSQKEKAPEAPIRGRWREGTCGIIPAGEAREGFLKDQLDGAVWSPAALVGCSRGWMPFPSWSRGAHYLGGGLEGSPRSPGLAGLLAGTHLGPCFYLGPAVQQKPHHDHVPPAGSNVQRRDAVLEGRKGLVRACILVWEAAALRPAPLWPCPSPRQAATRSPLLGLFSPKKDFKASKDPPASRFITASWLSPGPPESKTQAAIS